MLTTPLLGGIAPGAPQTASIRPVEIIVKGDHPYKNRGKGKSGCGYVLPDGQECRRAKSFTRHLSLPLSLNEIGSRGGHFTYKTFKAAWEEVLTKQLELSGLPAGWAPDTPAGTPRIKAIGVEALLCFPRGPTISRDQGNFRWFLEKCLGDALEAGGWIEDDSIYPERHFDFGNLDIEVRRGEAWSKMILFPG